MPDYSKVAALFYIPISNDQNSNLFLHILNISCYDFFIIATFPCGSAGKESACNMGGFNPWVGKIPCRRERLPTPVFGPREFHGLYSLWGHKESDTTESLSLSLSMSVKWSLLVILICISLMTFSVFSCAYYPFVRLLRNVYS